MLFFCMNLDTATGPGDFGTYFFQKYWDVVSHDVFHIVLQVFVKEWILPNYNSHDV